MTRAELTCARVRSFFRGCKRDGVYERNKQIFKAAKTLGITDSITIYKSFTLKRAWDQNGNAVKFR